MADKPEDVGLIEQRLLALRADGKAGRLIDNVATSRDLLKPRRAESIEEAKKIRELLTPRMKAELGASDRELVERAVSDQALQPLTQDLIPRSLTAGMREHDGRIDRSVLIFPSLDAGTWDGKRMGEFTRDVRDAAVVDGRAAPVAGSLLLSSDITQALRHAGVRVTGLALLAVLAVCFLAFRGKPKAAERPRYEAAGRLQGRTVLSLSAIGSLFVGVLLMMGAMAWLGERLNFSNFVALPITFGIGADYSINMLRRWQSDGHLRDALTATGGAVALCSATTIIGFGSLLAAQNRGLFSFGTFAVAGEVACLFAAIVALPCALELASRAGELATRRQG
jgi:predicted RND superfamily exporter protein